MLTFKKEMEKFPFPVTVHSFSLKDIRSITFLICHVYWYDTINIVTEQGILCSFFHTVGCRRFTILIIIVS